MREAYILFLYLIHVYISKLEGFTGARGCVPTEFDAEVVEGWIILLEDPLAAAKTEVNHLHLSFALCLPRKIISVSPQTDASFSKQ